MRGKVMRAANMLLSKRASDALLALTITLWLSYRIIMTSFLAAPVSKSGLISEAFVVHRVLLAAVLCELARIWRGEYGKPDAIALVVLVLMGRGPWLFGRDALLCDLVLVFAARGMNLDRLMRLCICVVTGCVIMVMACSAIGVIPDVVIRQWGDTRIRHCLGFTYCLFPAQYLFVMTATFCYLRDRSMSWAEVIILALLNAICFLLTDSRLSFGLALSAVALVVLRKHVTDDVIWVGIVRIARWSFIGMLGLSTAIVLLYALQKNVDATWLEGLNRLLGGRIRLTYDGLRDYGVRLFGQRVTWVGSGLDMYGHRKSGTYNYVDNFFFHALIQHGAVYTMGLICLYTRASIMAERSERHMLVLMLALLAVHCLLDDLSLQLHYNTLMFALSGDPLPSKQSARHFPVASQDSRMHHHPR